MDGQKCLETTIPNHHYWYRPLGDKYVCATVCARVHACMRLCPQEDNVQIVNVALRIVTVGLAVTVPHEKSIHRQYFSAHCLINISSYSVHMLGYCS